MNVDRLDNRGTNCALGLLRVKQRMAELPLGTLLEVVTRDRFSPYEVPAWAEREGLELEYSKRTGAWLFTSFIFGIRKTARVSAPKVRVA